MFSNHDNLTSFYVFFSVQITKTGFVRGSLDFRERFLFLCHSYILNIVKCKTNTIQNLEIWKFQCSIQCWNIWMAIFIYYDSGVKIVFPNYKNSVCADKKWITQSSLSIKSCLYLHSFIWKIKEWQKLFKNGLLKYWSSAKLV